MKRKPWTTYFMDLAQRAKTRSTCLRRRVGAVAVRNRRVIATGYNGPPRGVDHCEVTGCLRQTRGIPSGEQLDICRAVHAEQNLLTAGVDLEGCTIYCTVHPCFTCAKMLVNAGVHCVIFAGPYPDPEAKALFKATGVKVMQA